MAEPAPLHPLLPSLQISTHSRPKAAGGHLAGVLEAEGVSTHSESRHARRDVSTHSRPKAAGQVKIMFKVDVLVSTHSRPKAAGIATGEIPPLLRKFQHTAARRRLGSSFRCILDFGGSFNTQPPEGGWAHRGRRRGRLSGFNTQPPEGGWPNLKNKRNHI